MEPHISFAAEKIFELFGFKVTNSMLTSYFVIFVLILVAFLSTRKIAYIPGNLQSVVEIIVGGLYSLFESVTKEKTRQFFPLVATFFIYIIMANWMGLLPGVGSTGFYHLEHNKIVFTPLFRGATADLNTTLALALVSVLATQYYGIQSLGIKIYLKKFINFKDPISFFVGVLESISEVSKIISFSFRLFGNIFAGEVLLAVVAFLMPLFVPLPFIGLELFVGFIQALVFAMLTLVFLSVATSKH